MRCPFADMKKARLLIPVLLMRMSVFAAAENVFNVQSALQPMKR